MKRKRDNPRIQKAGMAHRKHHSNGRYYTATAAIQVSPAVKAGLIAIAENEQRSLSWVVNEVFHYYFGLKDDTELVGWTKRKTRMRLVK